MAILAILLVASIFTAVVQLIIGLLLDLADVTGGTEYGESWSVLLGTTLGITAMLPFAFWIQRRVFGVEGRWLISVASRVR